MNKTYFFSPNRERKKDKLITIHKINGGNEKLN